MGIIHCNNCGSDERVAPLGKGYQEVCSECCDFLGLKKEAEEAETGEDIEVRREILLELMEKVDI